MFVRRRQGSHVEEWASLLEERVPDDSDAETGRGDHHTGQGDHRGDRGDRRNN